MKHRFRLAFHGPIHFKYACQVRKRTVFGSVRNKLMERETYEYRQDGRKANIRLFEFDAPAGSVVVWIQFEAKQFVHTRVLPLTLG